MGDLYTRVKAIFDRYGVPSFVWYPIALAESGFNPDAIGDEGQSIGLFQVNLGTQGTGYTRDQLLNPEINAEVAAASIAAAYKAIAGTYSDELMAAEVARRSGHPGGSIENPFNDMDLRIINIRNLGKQFVLGTLGARLEPGGPANPPSPEDVIPGIGGVQGIGDFLASVQSFFQNIDVAGVGLVIVGVLLLLIALAQMGMENAGTIAQAHPAVKAVKAVAGGS